MPQSLQPNHLRQYRECGVVFPIRVLPPHETQAYSRACDDLEAALGGNPRTVELRQMHLHFRWAFELATHGPVVDAVADLLGPDLLIWATELFTKRPHDQALSIGWHRDGPYMGFDPPLVVTAWIALTPSTPANGCMQVVPELHPQVGSAGARTGQMAHRSESLAEMTAREPRPDEKPLDVVLAPGEMSLHSPYVLHGSGFNRSGEKRIGFVVRFVAPSARPQNGRPPAVLARGEDRCGHFQLLGPPADADLDRAIAGMRESAAQHLDAMLYNTKVRRRGTQHPPLPEVKPST
jgi:hypothetical protein